MVVLGGVAVSYERGTPVGEGFGGARSERSALHPRLPSALSCADPHGGVRPFQRKSICITQLTLGSYVVQIWSRNGRNFDPTKPSYSTEWIGCRSATPGCFLAASFDLQHQLLHNNPSLHTVEYAGFVDPRFSGVTLPNLHHIRRSS